MPSNENINGYRIMWIFTFFDLPTEKAKQRKAYTDFRKKLLKNGFTMMQYSVYIRHCASRQSMEAHIKRLESYLPPEGMISIMEVTDNQYGRIRNYWGMEELEKDDTPKQLEMF